MKKLQKILISLILCIILFNFIYPISYAITVKPLLGEFENIDSLADVGNIAIDGIVGIWSLNTRVAISSVLMAAKVLLSALVTGTTGGVGQTQNITPEDIIYTGCGQKKHQVDILDINFFDLSKSGAMDNDVVFSFRRNISKWYFLLRNLAIAISLVILLYIGIRVAISTVAQDEAKYKEMLINWLAGFALLFFLHVFIQLMLMINSQLVKIIYDTNQIAENSQTNMENIFQTLYIGTFGPGFIKGWGSLIVYLILIGVTIALFIMYFKRMFVVGLLIVIAPLITVTYSIDKLGDGKSQALSTWIKEFSGNVFIQPFHGIVYSVLASSAVASLNNGTPSLGAIVFAGFAVAYTMKSEALIKKIFGIENEDGAGGLLAAGAMVTGGLKKMLKIGAVAAVGAAGVAASGAAASGAGASGAAASGAAAKGAAASGATAKGAAASGATAKGAGASGATAKGAGASGAAGKTSKSSKPRGKIAQAIQKSAGKVGDFIDDKMSESPLGQAILERGGEIAEGIEEFNGKSIGEKYKYIKGNTQDRIEEFLGKNLLGLAGAAIALGAGSPEAAAALYLTLKNSKWQEKSYKLIRGKSMAEHKAQAQENQKDSMLDLYSNFIESKQGKGMDSSEELNEELIEDLLDVDLDALDEGVEKALAAQLQAIERDIRAANSDISDSQVRNQVKLQFNATAQEYKLVSEIKEKADDIRNSGDSIDYNEVNNILSGTVKPNIEPNGSELDLYGQIYKNREIQQAMGKTSKSDRARFEKLINNAIR